METGVNNQTVVASKSGKNMVAYVDSVEWSGKRASKTGTGQI